MKLREGRKAGWNRVTVLNLMEFLVRPTCQMALNSRRKPRHTTWFRRKAFALVHLRENQGEIYVVPSQIGRSNSRDSRRRNVACAKTISKTLELVFALDITSFYPLR